MSSVPFVMLSDFSFRALHTVANYVFSRLNFRDNFVLRQDISFGHVLRVSNVNIQFTD